MTRYGLLGSQMALTLMLAPQLTGCETTAADDDDDDTYDLDDIPMGTMEADVDGAHWTAANANANDTSAGGVTVTLITGATISADVMNISLVGIDVEGTYDFSDDNVPGVTASFTDTGSIGETFGAQSGTLEIIYFGDDRVEGTFDFEGLLADQTSTVSVTHGEFNVEWGLFPGF